MDNAGSSEPKSLSFAFLVRRLNHNPESYNALNPKPSTLTPNYHLRCGSSEARNLSPNNPES